MVKEKCGCSRCIRLGNFHFLPVCGWNFHRDDFKAKAVAITWSSPVHAKDAKLSEWSSLNRVT